MMMKKGRLFVISAPSGTGKSTVLLELRRIFPQLKFSVSCTTRSKRHGESDGVDYYFIDRPTFDKMVENGKFAEWAIVHDERYGTLRSELEDAISGGYDLLLDVDVQGGMAIKKAFSEAVMIFLMPPGMDALEKRLSGRGTDSPDQIKLRLENARKELSYRKHYEYEIVNDEVKEAVQEIARIISCKSS